MYHEINNREPTMKSFTQFIESQQELVPIIGLDPALTKQFADAINTANSTKSIYNVELKELKGKFARVYDRYRNGIHDQMVEIARGKEEERVAGKWVDEEMYQLTWDFPYNAHQLGKFIRTIKSKTSKYPIFKDVVPVLEQFYNYSNAFKNLKPYIIKGRVPNPNAVTKEQFRPEMLNSSTLKLVTDILTNSVDKHYVDLVKIFIKQYNSIVDEFLEKRKDGETPYNYYRKSPDNREITSRLVTTTGANSFVKWVDAIKINDFDKVAEKMAKARADFMKQQFLYKNIGKIGSVIYKKQSPVKSTSAHGRMDGFGFNGQITFKFEDGTQFTVRNKAVYVWGMRTDFYRFPTTFHDVYFTDGKSGK